MEHMLSSAYTDLATYDGCAGPTGKPLLAQPSRILSLGLGGPCIAEAQA